MQIDVQGGDFALTEGLSSAIVEAARRYGASFQRLVRKVAVRVYDLNGPRGGPDKGCLVVADLVDGRVVVSAHVDSDLYRAIPRTFAKLKRGTQSRRRRAQTLRRPTRVAQSAGRGLLTLANAPLSIAREVKRMAEPAGDAIGRDPLPTE